MSHARNRAKKDRRKLWPDEWKAVANKIRSGVFPRWFLTKLTYGSNLLARDIKGRLTWRQESTFIALTTNKETKPNG